MFQDPRLLPWRNILQNVQLGLPKSQHALAEELLEKVGLKRNQDNGLPSFQVVNVSVLP